MSNMREALRAHKKLFRGLALGYIVFINCFGFPIYNLSREWSASITAMSVYIVAVGAVFTGVWLAAVYPDKRFSFILSAIVLLACGGLGCRFLLEFGEISNTYNFTAPNVALHLGAYVALCFFSWLWAAPRMGRG